MRKISGKPNSHLCFGLLVSLAFHGAALALGNLFLAPSIESPERRTEVYLIYIHREVSPENRGVSVEDEEMAGETSGGEIGGRSNPQADKSDSIGSVSYTPKGPSGGGLLLPPDAGRTGGEGLASDSADRPARVPEEAEKAPPPPDRIVSEEHISSLHDSNIPEEEPLPPIEPFGIPLEPAHSEGSVEEVIREGLASGPEEDRLGAGEASLPRAPATDGGRFGEVIVRAIRRAQSEVGYPLWAQLNNWEGRVEVRFLVSTAGEIEEIEVALSSGYDLLDRSALETIERAGPFPVTLPEKMWFKVPIVYKLE
ncbi:MAG: energy transducer TonB family protein [bacterium]